MARPSTAVRIAWGALINATTDERSARHESRCCRDRKGEFMHHPLPNRLGYVYLADQVHKISWIFKRKANALDENGRIASNQSSEYRSQPKSCVGSRSGLPNTTLPMSFATGCSQLLTMQKSNVPFAKPLCQDAQPVPDHHPFVLRFASFLS
jgi:hypothetical protein